ncbi:MAG: hypothetical protein ACI906_000912 [Candidatus Latescibacterota bacterium]|jgi:hypothetical protein
MRIQSKRGLDSLTFYLLVLTTLLAVASCSEKSSEKSDSAQIDTYLDQVKYVLQEVRSMEKEIALAVPADSVTAEVIAPLIGQRFRPKLADLSKQTEALKPSHPDLQPSYQLLKDYLRLRIEGFDLIIEGARLQDQTLFDQFSERLAEAEEVGQSLEMAIDRVQQSMGQP